jgi:hypothetical protein
MKSYQKILSGIAVVILVVGGQVKADTIAQWNFETPTSTNAINLALTPGAGGTNGPVSPDVGSGSAIASHAGAATYSTPAGDLDPVIAALDPGAIAATNNPSSHAWSANNWASGDYFQFKVNTSNYTNILVAWDQTGSNTGPRDFQLKYSLDGTTYSVMSNFTLVFASWNATSAQGNSLSANFAGAVDNASTVYFRLVDNSAVNMTGGTVATGGTGRIDNFTVIGTIIPEPSTMLLVGVGLAGLFVIRRRRA